MHTDAKTAEHTNDIEGEHKGAIKTEHTDDIKAEHTDALKAEHTDALKVEHTDALKAEHTDALKAEHTDVLKAEHTRMLPDLSMYYLRNPRYLYVNSLMPCVNLCMQNSVVRGHSKIVPSEAALNEQLAIYLILQHRIFVKRKI